MNVFLQKTVVFSAGPASGPVHGPTGLRLLEEGRLERLREIWPVNLEVARKRMRRGDQCWVVEVNGSLAHYSWVQRVGTHRIADAGRRVRILPGEAWVYHCRTASHARGQGLYPAVLRAIRSWAGRAGVSRLLIYTSAANVASRRGIAKAGFRSCATLVSLRIGAIVLPVSGSLGTCRRER